MKRDLVDSPYVGDWMASIYDSRGRRWDLHWFLSPYGAYERILRSERDEERCDRGRWRHRDDEEVIHLEPDAGQGEDSSPSNWQVLTTPTCEESNLVMLLIE